jgi:hypothetical protein
MSNPKFLTDDQRNRFFSDKFFRYIFGRKPNLSRDRTVLVSYLASIEKADPESLQLMLDAGHEQRDDCPRESSRINMGSRLLSFMRS